MLYSKEKISINNTEREVYLYLKKTSNHSYRISSEKISLTLPHIYKNPETIAIHKKSLLEKVIERIHAQPELLPKERLLDKEFIRIYNDIFQVIPSSMGAKFELNPLAKTIQLTENREKNKTKLHTAISKYYTDKIDRRIRTINQITTQKPILSVSLKNNQSSWGLCSSKGDITISINTLLTPLWVLDYVIVHELCHLIHHDHSAEFWSLVERYYPKYKLAKKYLKEIGFSLMY